MRATRRSLLAAGLAALGGCSSTDGTDRSETADGTGNETGPEDGTDSAGGVGASGDAQARIGFVGDVMLGRSVNDHWVGEEPAGVWGSTLQRLQELDGLVANLECCISEGGDRWPDKVYYFRSDPSFAVPALSAAAVSVAALANNHILDFREPALLDTLDNLAGAGIAQAGAGPDRSSAFAPAVTDMGDLTVATLSLTDQWAEYAASEDSAGTAYIPLAGAEYEARSLVEEALARVDDPDLVAVTLHWGPNWETAPDETQEEFARWLIDQGVDVVHGHSAHVLQGVEVYNGRPIIYDAGDFVDDYIHKEGYHNKHSGLFELVVSDGELDELRVVPTEIIDETAELAGEGAAEWVRGAIRERSQPWETPIERSGAGLVIPLGE